MNGWLQDLRYGWRMLAKNPGFTLVVVLAMGLGIGVNASIFTIVRGVLLRSYPLPQVERVVALEVVSPRFGSEPLEMSALDFLDYRERATSYTAIGAHTGSQIYTSLGAEPERFRSSLVTPGMLPALGVRPILGRWFTEQEGIDGNQYASVIISHRIWTERLGSDPNVIGRTFRMSGRMRTVVGVMPPGFRFPETTDFYVPLAFDLADENRGSHYLEVAARLKPGVTIEQARAEAATIAAALAREYPETNQGTSSSVVPISETFARHVRISMIMLTCAVVFVLLIACANVANLLLARAATRHREMSLRVALGGSRVRIARQLLTESVLISLLGGTLGYFLAYWANDVIIASIPMELPFWMKFEFDGAVVAVTAAISVLCGVVFGLAPALQVSSDGLYESLKEGGAQGGTGRGHQRLRNGLVVAEVALAMVLLVGSGLMIRSFLRQQEVGSGFDPTNVLVGTVTLPYAVYPEDEQKRQFFASLMPELQRLPGVVAASGGSGRPLGQDSWGTTVMLEGREQEPESQQPITSFGVVQPGYFATLRIPLREGRDFQASDQAGAPQVAIVNQSAARLLWPGQSPLGKRFKFDKQDSVYKTVVGVVGDVRQSARRKRVESVYVPHAQKPVQTLTLFLRTRGESAALTPAVRALIQRRDPDLPLIDAGTLQASIGNAVWELRLYASLMAGYAVIALVIAAIGIYGVMAYRVAQRTQEIGIRMALGAQQAAVLRMVVGQGVRLTALGVGIGLAVAFGVTRLMASILFGVNPSDPPTYTVVALILAASALLASWLPAWRASRVDPMVALRHE